MKLTPSLVADESGVDKWAHLVRTYFRMDGHHIQFNVVGADTLRAAQADPQNYRNLIVRVAGYSDYFCDLSRELQEEIITRADLVLATSTRSVISSNVFKIWLLVTPRRVCGISMPPRTPRRKPLLMPISSSMR